jgi:6-methylpretetramide 4-monooxygenase / 4-hydroxy-6-methylpretetramide 12a-monooxygenase
MKEVDVLAVGGGAAGTMLTLELGRRGVKFLTVDRLPRPSETSNAITVHARTLETFERIDKRLVARYLERGIHNKGYVLHFVDGNGRRSEVRPGLDFTTLDSRYPYLLVNRQSETEQFLREYAGAQYGASIEWGTQCVDVSQDADGVTAQLETDGKRYEVRCRYLVACDGINSLVRRKLALEQQESG